MQAIFQKFSNLFSGKSGSQEDLDKDTAVLQKEDDKHDTYEAKAKIVDNFLRSNSPEKGFLMSLHFILKEPYECYYRIDLLCYFLESFKKAHLKEYKESLLTVGFFQDLLTKTNFLEYIAIFLKDFVTFHGGYPPSILELVLAKIQSFSPEELRQRFYIVEVGEYIALKKSGRSATEPLNKRRAYLIKRALKLIFEDCFGVVMRQLPQQSISYILFQWLLFIDIKTEITDYQLSYEICRALIDSVRDKDNLIIIKELRITLLSLIDLCSMQFTSQDTFRGYKSLPIVLEMMDNQAIIDCMYEEGCFEEIYNILSTSRENLLQVLHNLVRVNLLSNSCTLIRALSENFLLKNMYDWVILIFQEIVCPYLIPKLRVARCREANMDVCELYFYGLCDIGLNLSDSVIQSLLTNLKFFVTEVYMSPEQRPWLLRYLEFLYLVWYLYQKSSESKELFQELGTFIDTICKEFDCQITQKDFEQKLKLVEARVWNISHEDLAKLGRLSAIDRLSQDFVRNKQYKGIKNIGNSKNFEGRTFFVIIMIACYLASTMQALFMTDDFRLLILQLYKRDTEKLEKLKKENDKIVVEEEKKEEKNETVVKKEIKELEEEKKIDEILKEKPKEEEKKEEVKESMIVEKKRDILRETELLFCQLANGEEDYADPRNFKETLPDQFRLANEEQDTSEFLQFYLDCLEESLKGTPEKDVINDLFAGESANTWECQECMHSRTKKTKFMHIGLNFADKKSQTEDQIDMLKRAFDADLSDGGAGIFCEHCQKKSSLTIQTTKILKLPPYLVVTLNRFYYDRGQQQGSKIFTFVNLHEYLNLKQVWKEQLDPAIANYQLYAIIIHKGFTTEHGHYYAIVRSNESQDQWILINDSTAFSINPQLSIKELLSQYEEDTPYVLLYRQNL